MSLDQEIQLRNWDDLVGHTIKAVISDPLGKRNAQVVIVTETGCWMALDAEGGYYDEAPTIEVLPSFYGGSDVPLSEYISAGDAFHSGLINQATYELMRAKEEEALVDEKKLKVERLRKQLAELEGKTS